jgi:hypothetical protein
MFNYHIESYTFVIADELKKLLETKKNTNSLFETTKEFIKFITQLIMQKIIDNKDPQIDRKLIFFDFSGYMKCGEDTILELKGLVKELFTLN